jgi:hypothetical protein
MVLQEGLPKMEPELEDAMYEISIIKMNLQAMDDMISEIRGRNFNDISNFCRDTRLHGWVRTFPEVASNPSLDLLAFIKGLQPPPKEPPTIWSQWMLEKASREASDIQDNLNRLRV